MSVFDAQKKSVLSQVDLSRKGGIDAPIQELVEELNRQPDLLTLSSCSGRILLLREGRTEKGKIQKKGCHWIEVHHSQVHPETLWENFLGQARLRLPGCLTLKFEPFILHLQCRTIELAKKLHTIRSADPRSS